MKKTATIFLVITNLFILPFFCQAQLVITTEINPTLLAQKLVGDGVRISNATLTPNALIATGFFKNMSGTNINLDSGIVLTNGRAKTDLAGPLYGMDIDGSFIAYNERASANLFLPGDADLANETGIDINNLNDAVALEFDFIPFGDTIQFKYVFGSEEYTTGTVCQFTDPFAFFISGPGITGLKNIALVPGTSLPVTPKNVNDFIFTGGCVNNPQYYVDNTYNTFFIYNGHTKVFVAKSLVQPCQLYHFKLIVADFGDHIWDTGVLIEANSLTSNTVHIDNHCPIDGNTPYLVEGCNTGAINIYRSKKSPNPQNVTLTFAGTAYNGTDVQTINTIATIAANDSVVVVPILPIVDNLPEGIEKLKIYVSLGCVNASTYADSITIDVRDYDTLALAPGDSVGICKGNTVQLNAFGAYATYNWNNAATLNNPNISNPIATATLNRTTYICTATQGSCNARDSVIIKMKDIELVSKTDVSCFGASTGSIRAGGGWEWSNPVEFSINNGAYQPTGLFTNLPVGIYKIKMRDATGCSDSMNVTLGLTNTPLLVNATIGAANCNGIGGTLNLTAVNGQSPFLFSIDGINYSSTTAYTVNGGAQMIYASDANGCIDSKQVTVPNDPPINFTTAISPAGCSGNADGTITVTASGGNNQYLYSLDGINFQTNNLLQSTTGSKTVTVKDVRGCMATQIVNVPLNNTVTVNAGNAISICEGNSDTLRAVSNANSFAWTPTAHLSSATVLRPLALPVLTTTYTLTATTGICNSTATVIVTVLPAPIPNAGPDSIICFGKNIQLAGTGGTSFLWTPVTLLDNNTIQNPTVLQAPTGSITYNLSVKDINGCNSLITDAVKITILPAAKLFVGNDTSVAINQPLQLLAKDINNTGFVNYVWSPSTGLNNPAIQNPIAVLSAPEIMYNVTASTANGCVGLDNIKIKTFKGPDIYVPNAFSPNNDKLNDLLKPILIGMKSLHYFTIYNRYGQVLFTTSTENAGWDGSFNGKLQAMGGYVWIAEAVDYKGNIIQRKGVTLLVQ